MTSVRATRSVVASLMLLSSLACVVSAQAKADQSVEVKRGIAAYNGKNYAQALSSLQGTNSPVGHYYRALSYQAMGRYAEAEHEYDWNYKNATDKDLSYKSWQGLQGLARMKSKRAIASDTRSKATDSASSGEAGASTQSGSAPIKYGYTPQNQSNQPAGIKYTFTPGCPRHR